MGVTRTASTLPDGWTPICNDCGVALCWDISEYDYNERPAFWDAWLCKECLAWQRKQSERSSSAGQTPPG